MPPLSAPSFLRNPRYRLLANQFRDKLSGPSQETRDSIISLVEIFSPVIFDVPLFRVWNNVTDSIVDFDDGYRSTADDDFRREKKNAKLKRDELQEGRE